MTFTYSWTDHRHDQGDPHRPGFSFGPLTPCSLCESVTFARDQHGQPWCPLCISAGHHLTSVAESHQEPSEMRDGISEPDPLVRLSSELFGG